MDDDGLFELSFRMTGPAIRIQWRGLEMADRITSRKQRVDFDSLTDFVMKLSFTSREEAQKTR